MHRFGTIGLHRHRRSKKRHSTDVLHPGRVERQMRYLAGQIAPLDKEHSTDASFRMQRKDKSSRRLKDV
jgi:hypothetical protein